jgi:hypothetical protein
MSENPVLNIFYRFLGPVLPIVVSDLPSSGNAARNRNTITFGEGPSRPRWNAWDDWRSIFGPVPEEDRSRLRWNA